MKTALIGLAGAWLALLTPAASAAPPLDCPVRTAAFSVDSPLIDILASPAAKAVVQRERPELLQGLAQIPGGTQAPSITAILTLRSVTMFGGRSAPDLTALDRALRALPVTPGEQAARCARYDDDRRVIAMPPGHPRLLLFEKINGFRDGPSVAAAHAAVAAMAQRNGWALVASDKGGAINPAMLKRFDAVIWNNTSGDVLTLSQRRAFERYIAGGGGFVGVHGSAGDYLYDWTWYADRLLGARFIGHPMGPQFQAARIAIEASPSAIGARVAPGWTMTDEWYSFRTSARANGAHVVATLDEASYSPKGIGGQDLRMGDHPIAWTRCVGRGRMFYSAIGHRPEGYAEPHYVALLDDAIRWAAGGGTTVCRGGREVPRR